LSEANGIDMSGPVRLAEVDERMIRALMLKDYFRYLVLTVTGKGVGDRVWPA
jgi:O-antigen biosynthesis protein WbqP